MIIFILEKRKEQQFIVIILLSKVQRYIHTKQNQLKANIDDNEIERENISIDYYQIPLEHNEIIFVDSMSTYERLINRLFKNNTEEILIGFDCKLDFDESLFFEIDVQVNGSHYLIRCHRFDNA